MLGTECRARATSGRAPGPGIHAALEGAEFIDNSSNFWLLRLLRQGWHVTT